MIDVHNHLLPGLDDGARNMDEALAMARQAVDDGITHLVCTPHIRPGRYDNQPEGIHAALADFRAGLTDASIPLQVAAAAEMHFDLEIITQAQSASLPWLGQWHGKPVLLLEFPHSYLPVGAERLTEWLVTRDFLPMIAHPERNRDFVNDLNRLEPFLDQGCLTQITASALTGQFGERVQTCAEALVDGDDVTCLASDAHNPTNRPCRLSESAAVVTRRFGPERAQALTRDNPWQLAAEHFPG